jgi:hypothetical protein
MLKLTNISRIQKFQKSNTLFKNNIRHKSAFSNVFANVEKGTILPGACMIMKKNEYIEYKFYRKLRHGDINWIKDNINHCSFDTKELSKYISSIKNVNLNNILISTVCTVSVLKIAILSHNLAMLGGGIYILLMYFNTMYSELFRSNIDKQKLMEICYFKKMDNAAKDTFVQ